MARESILKNIPADLKPRQRFNTLKFDASTIHCNFQWKCIFVRYGKTGISETKWIQNLLFLLEML